MKTKIFARIIITTLLVTFLTLNVGRVTSVYALADPVIPAELAPVYDTQIIQLQDYIQNNVTPPQFEVFNILLGLYVASQGGFSEYKLQDPYGTQDGVLNWLKSCGIQLYNSLIGMGALGTDPITGIDYRPYIKGAMDIAMGCAVKSTQYTDTNDFVSDVNVQDKYFIPMDFGIQGALNYIFSKEGGLYNWQFERSEFTSNLVYRSVFLPPTSSYWTLFNSLSLPRVRYNAGWSNDWYNGVVSGSFFQTYHNFFLNTTDGHYYFLDDNGNPIIDNNPYFINYDISFRDVYYFQGDPSVRNNGTRFLIKYEYVTRDTYQDIVQYYCDHPESFTSNSDYIFYVSDFIEHWYYGSSWNNKTEIFHDTNLNLDLNTLPYYQQIANDYLLDVKGILSDLIGEVDLTNVILNNLFDLEGVIVQDPKLIRVTTDILEEIQILNPPLPVNLNDFDIYTKNEYLEEIKDRSEKFGEAIGEYFVFWHNSDPVTVYVLFGSIVVILLGAFVGKLGHS